MSLTYVITDIHGRCDLLTRALTEISAHASGKAGLIVAIGDYVDKGPDSKQVIDLLLSGVPDGWGFVALKGNHDAMMQQALRDPAKMDWWRERGGDTALQSYGGDSATVPQTHIAWLDQLRLIHVDAHRVYVHAGVDSEVPLDQQSEETLLWKRYPKGYADGFGGLHVVHGHDNDPDGPQLFQGHRGFR
jgi:serine/threonine protein phosphatase 1